MVLLSETSSPSQGRSFAQIVADSFYTLEQEEKAAPGLDCVGAAQGLVQKYFGNRRLLESVGLRAQYQKLAADCYSNLPAW